MKCEICASWQTKLGSSFSHCYKNSMMLWIPSTLEYEYFRDSCYWLSKTVRLVLQYMVIPILQRNDNTLKDHHHTHADMHDESINKYRTGGFTTGICVARSKSKPCSTLISRRSRVKTSQWVSFTVCYPYRRDLHCSYPILQYKSVPGQRCPYDYERAHHSATWRFLSFLLLTNDSGWSVMTVRQLMTSSEVQWLWFHACDPPATACQRDRIRQKLKQADDMLQLQILLLIAVACRHLSLLWFGPVKNFCPNRAVAPLAAVYIYTLC